MPQGWHLTTLISGAFGHVWCVDWVPEWRNAAPAPGGGLPPSVRHLAVDLAQMVNPTTTVR